MHTHALSRRCISKQTLQHQTPKGKKPYWDYQPSKEKITEDIVSLQNQSNTSTWVSHNFCFTRSPRHSIKLIWNCVSLSSCHKKIEFHWEMLVEAKILMSPRGYRGSWESVPLADGVVCHLKKSLHYPLTCSQTKLLSDVIVSRLNAKHSTNVSQLSTWNALHTSSACPKLANWLQFSSSSLQIGASLSHQNLSYKVLWASSTGWRNVLYK